MCARVLVTGGAGFLGSHLCERLLDADHEVICLDNFTSGRRANLDTFAETSRFRVLRRDVQTPGSLPQVDRIYHLASRASPAEFTEFPVRIALANTEGTRRLLDHARNCDARMVFASTSEVYGDPAVHPQPETYRGNVNVRGPRGCYDESKRFGETLTVAYRRQYDLEVRTARIFNTYGPRMRPDDGRVVPTFVTQALADRDLTVYGDGTQTRSFCYVSDLVDGLVALMDADELEYSAYNLGNDTERTVLELAEAIVDLAASDAAVVHQPRPADDPDRRRPDLTRATDGLGWEPTVTLRDGLERTIASFPGTSSE